MTVADEGMSATSIKTVAAYGHGGKEEGIVGIITNPGDVTPRVQSLLCLWVQGAVRFSLPPLPKSSRIV